MICIFKFYLLKYFKYHDLGVTRVFLTDLGLEGPKYEKL